MCENKEIYSCEICKACKLFKSYLHKRFFYFSFKKSFTKEKIEEVLLFLSKNTYKGFEKKEKTVFLITNISILSDINQKILSKIISPSKKNLYFLLSSESYKKNFYFYKSLIPIINIPPPSEENAIKWIKRKFFLTKDEITFAVRISENYPIEAERVLKKIWKDRKNFCSILNRSILNRDPIDLFLFFYKKKYKTIFLYWTVSFIIDAVKWKAGIKNFFFNTDCIYIIKNIGDKFSTNFLLSTIVKWIDTIKIIEKEENIGREMLILNNLIF
ncbi:hypothetical protein AOQ89_00545 [bacterium endosymbiont of Pedicinus badii]|nr:hypothetical protein AOQ89_00545 [bacterium endosymbiont of Pedicinus badii]